MSYYKELGLEKEPFSTSPDPEFFYHSTGHDAALRRLEIGIRLRRGLSIILGDVGTGKTTLSRILLQEFEGDDDFIFHMILDPGYKSELQFLAGIAKMFGIAAQSRAVPDLKEALEKFLFQKGIEENKTIVLLIDEGQKINSRNLEVLRTLLNFETNKYKLLQLVILAQAELLPRIKAIRNFMDRVALKYKITPFDAAETGEMIEFRLRQAGYSGAQPLFTDGAIKLIYKYTQGYPRQIARICHDALEVVVMQEKTIVDADVLNSLIAKEME